MTPLLKRLASGLFPERISACFYALSTWIALLLARKVIYGIDTELRSFSNRTIGIVVFAGIDSSKITSTYVMAIVIAIAGIFLLSVIFQLLFNVFKIDVERYTGERNFVFLISTFGVFIVLWAELFANTSPLNVVRVINLVLLMVFAHLILKNVFQKNEFINSLLSSPVLSVLAFLLPFSVIFSLWVLNKHNFIFDTFYSYLYFVIVLIWYVVFGVLKKLFSSITADNLYQLIGLSAIPLILIPLSIPLSNEIQYTFSRYIHSARIVSAVFITFLIAISVFIFLFRLYKVKKFVNTHRLITLVYFPIIIATLFTYFSYRHFIVLDKVDMFHHGEYMLTVQQMWQYGKVPFIDIYPTHGLSNLFPQILYSIVNGYHMYEPSLWHWLYYVLHGLLLYFLLRILFTSELALLGVLFLPLETLFRSYYSMAIFPAIIIARTFANKPRGLSTCLILWSSLLFTFVWRVDFGIAALLSTAAIFAVNYLKKFITGDLNKKEIKDLLVSAGIVFGSGITVFVLLAVLKGVSLKDLIVQNYLYITFQGPVQSYVKIFESFGPLVFIQYFIVPTISIFYILYFIYITLLKRQEFGTKQLVLVFLAIFSLIVSIRSTQRHSLIEGYAAYLFPFLAASVYIFIKPREVNKSLIAFLIVSMAYLLMLPDTNSYSLLASTVNSMRPGASAPGRFGFHHWKYQEPRSKVNESQYNSLVEFMDKNLKPGQTFFDFTNSPILYIGTEKEFLTYLIPLVYNASDQIQEIQLRNLQSKYEDQKIPFVVFRNGTPALENFDGVPNEIRHYKLAEFIYRNYYPYKSVGTYQIWQAKNAAAEDSWAYEEFQLNCVAKFNPRQLQYNDVVVEKKEADLIKLKSGQNDPYFYNFFDDKNRCPALSPTRYWFLRIKYKSDVSGNLQALYLFEGQNNYSVEQSAFVNIDSVSESTITLPLVNLSEIGKLEDVRLDPPSGSSFELSGMEIISLKHIESKMFNQSFDLMKLPYIWGEFDTKDAAEKTQVQAELLQDGLVELEAEKPLLIKIPKDIDKTSGNYLHFRIQANHEGTIQMKYGVGDYRNSTVTFTAVPSEEPVDYLVRVSSQWKWMSEPVDSLEVVSDQAISIEQISIRKGD